MYFHRRRTYTKRLSKPKFVTCNLKIYAAIKLRRNEGLSIFYTSSASHAPIDTCVYHV